MGRFSRYFVWIAIGGALVTAAIVYRDKAEKESERLADERRAELAAEERRLSDPAEMERLLRERILVQDGIIVIKNKWTHSVKAIPTPTPWVVHCGILGVTVSFGADGDEFDGLGVRLSEVRLSPDQCVSVSRSTARILRSMLGEPSELLRRRSGSRRDEAPD